MTDDNAALDLLTKWRAEICQHRQSQHICAQHCGRWNIRLGTAVIIFNAIIGSSIYATYDNADSDKRIIVALAFLSITAAVLAALQTFLKFSERAEEHQSACRRFHGLGLEVEKLIALTPPNMNDIVQDIEKRFQSAVEESPRTHDAHWKKAGSICREEVSESVSANAAQLSNPSVP